MTGPSQTDSPAAVPPLGQTPSHRSERISAPLTG